MAQQKGISKGTTANRSILEEGKIRFNTTTGLLEYYNGTAWAPIDTPPTVSSVSGELFESDNSTIVITGSFFSTSATAQLISNSGTTISFDTVVRDSSSQLTCTLNSGNLGSVDEPYDIKVINSSGLASVLEDALNVDESPVWVTTSGALGNVSDSATGTHFTLSATDPESQAISYYLKSGSSLPGGMSLNSSTGAISGDPTNVGGNTTTTFTVQATDPASNVTERQFNITVTPTLDGSSSARANISCKAIFDLGTAFQGSSASGLYYITNYGTISAEQHYCQMDTSYNGGGYTLLFAANSARNNFSGTNYQFNLNNTATPSPDTVYARTRGSTFTPASGDKFLLERRATGQWIVGTINTWAAGSSWAHIDGHAYLGSLNNATSENTENLTSNYGIDDFECCAQSGGCQNSGGELCGFGTGSSHGCYNHDSNTFCYGGGWDNSNAALMWGGGNGSNNFEGTYAAYYYRRDSNSQ